MFRFEATSGIAPSTGFEIADKNSFVQCFDQLELSLNPAGGTFGYNIYKKLVTVRWTYASPVVADFAFQFFFLDRNDSLSVK